MLKIGFVGWRGMVGSVLLERMLHERDLTQCEPIFFTTSNVGGNGPDIGVDIPPLKDAYDLTHLAQLDIIVSCQGGAYTQTVYANLRNNGWQGYWIDSASTLRMDHDSIIVLDPVNRQVIDSGLIAGIKTFIGGNCTVSLMLMAFSGLFAYGYIEWLTSMTYQAASGAGAQNMKELIAQMTKIGDVAGHLLSDPATSALEIDAVITETLRDASFPHDHFGAPLAASLIPWIDTLMENGQTREEWKGYAETNKILQSVSPIPVDGICVRVGAMRCHSQAFTIKLTHNIPIDEVKDIIGQGNPWVNLIPNTREATLAHLTPAAVNGTLTVPVGRLRTMRMGESYITAFSVGDQLLWGAAEPLRRILGIIKEHLLQ